MPKTAYALYAWSVIIHTFIQIPGFYQVMRNALTGLQRFDYAQVMDIAAAAIFPILAQPVFVSIMVAWGAAPGLRQVDERADRDRPGSIPI